MLPINNIQLWRHFRDWVCAFIYQVKERLVHVRKKVVWKVTKSECSLDSSKNGVEDQDVLRLEELLDFSKFILWSQKRED